MKRNDDVLERLAPLSGAPSRGLEDLLRLRAKRQLAQKIGTIAVVAALVVALGIGVVTIGDRGGRPADPPDVLRAPTFKGLVIRGARDHVEGNGELVAQNPGTGDAITIVDRAPDLSIGWAASSADGRWVAFESPRCTEDATEDWEAQSGLWVTNGVDEPRQLTAPCVDDPDGPMTEGLWAWSPTGSHLVAVAGGSLMLIDAATGERTDLGESAGGVTSLAWSPDGTQIAYATPSGSVYEASVDGGEHRSIAESLGHVPGGEEGSGLQWSPDGTRIAVLADVDPSVGFPEGTLYVMNADGSGRRALAEGILIEHILGSPNVAWSPDGASLAYATQSDERDHFRVWSVTLDGSAPVLVFSATGLDPNQTRGGPVWPPDGNKIAFRSANKTWSIANADGSGDVHEIDALKPLSWRGGWYFCECYG